MDDESRWQLRPCCCNAAATDLINGDVTYYRLVCCALCSANNNLLIKSFEVRLLLLKTCICTCYTDESKLALKCAANYLNSILLINLYVFVDPWPASGVSRSI